MSFNEAACCFDASMYTGVPDAAPCAQSLDTKGIIAGLDKLLFSGDDAAAGEYLDRWCQKAQEAGDWRTELTLQSELMGFHRRTSDKAAAMAAVERGLELIREHRLGSTVSGATIILNAATTLKAYGMAAQSIPMFMQSCRVYSQTLDPLDYRFGGLYNNMALSYADIGEYDTAEGYYKKALGVIAHCDSPSPTATLRSFTSAWGVRRISQRRSSWRKTTCTPPPCRMTATTISPSRSVCRPLSILGTSYERTDGS